jgi:ribosome-associated heat shock protein Hsp15
MAGKTTGIEQRIDQWLWYARLAKSRTLAQALIGAGKVRLNRTKIEKASTSVRSGDVLTLAHGGKVLTLEVLAIGKRRGPAPEAQLLYREISGLPIRNRLENPSVGLSGEPVRQAERADGAGRPTKRDRRLTDLLRGRG